ncbi:hypothetical protein NQZ68_000988 [Dissostichus eleginoides]|nr:hypothetical protein NQZ68_000988 [Dissostichus eleginoides]
MEPELYTETVMEGVKAGGAGVEGAGGLPQCRPVAELKLNGAVTLSKEPPPPPPTHPLSEVTKGFLGKEGNRVSRPEAI